MTSSMRVKPLIASERRIMKRIVSVYGATVAISLASTTLTSEVLCPATQEPTSGCGSKDIARLSDAFLGRTVKRYAAAVRAERHPLTVHEPPAEYERMVACQKNAVPVLITLLEHQDVDVRYAAYAALRKITNRSFGACWLDYGGQGCEDPRSVGADQWKQWWANNAQKSVSEWLIDDLKDPAGRGIRVAISRLGWEGHEKAVPALRGLLRVSESDIRFLATEALARLGDECSVPYLVDLYLQQEKASYRRQGIELLESLTGKRFGYDPQSQPGKRRESVRLWRQWWSEKKKDCGDL